MSLNERYRAIYMRLWGFRDFCDEQHNITMRELEKELSVPTEALPNTTAQEVNIAAALLQPGCCGRKEECQASCTGGLLLHERLSFAERLANLVMKRLVPSPLGRK